MLYSVKTSTDSLVGMIQPRRTANPQGGDDCSLPPYQVPLAPLDQNAIAHVQQMHRTQPFSELKQSLRASSNIISNLAGDLAEQQTDLVRTHEKRKEKNRQLKQAAENGGDAEVDIDERAENSREDRVQHSQGEAERLGAELEKLVRELIDRSERIETALEKCRTIPRELERLSRRHAAQAPSGHDSAEEDIDIDRENIAGPSHQLKGRLEEWELENQGKTMTARYTAQNDYINYKKVVHEGIHGKDVEPPPLPNPNLWFDDGDRAMGNGDAGPTQPQDTQSGNADQDEDSDVEFARAVKPLRCPLTLMYYKDPLTSTKCPHSFEKAAILEMISQSPCRINSPNALQNLHNPMPTAAQLQEGDQAVRCPSAGCSAMLCDKDLKEDPVLQRQAARRQRLDEGGGRNNASSDIEEGITIGDGDDDEDDFRNVGSQSVGNPRSSAKLIRMKRERMTPRPTPGRT